MAHELQHSAGIMEQVIIKASASIYGKGFGQKERGVSVLHTLSRFEKVALGVSWWRGACVR